MTALSSSTKLDPRTDFKTNCSNNADAFAVEGLQKTNRQVCRVEVEEAFAVKLKSGYIIHAGPPPSSGIILAYILRILDGILPAKNASLDAHRFIEACKYGYGERSHLGDRNFVDVSNVRFYPFLNFFSRT